MFDLLKQLKRLLRRKLRRYRIQRRAGGESAYGKFWIRLITVFAILFSAFLFPVSQVFTPLATPKIGDIATEDIIAPFDFPVKKTDEEIEKEKRDLESRLPAMLSYDQGIVDSVNGEIDRFFFLLDSLKHRTKRPQRIADKVRLFYPEISKKQLTKLAAADSLTRLISILKSSIRERYIIGIANDEGIIPEGYPYVVVQKSQGEYSFSRDQVMGLTRAQQELKDEFELLESTDSLDLGFLYEIGKDFLVPNLEFSLSETGEKREEALAQVQPNTIAFKAGQRLIAKNQQITETHIKWLSALAKHRSDAGIDAGVWQYLFPILSRIAFIAFILISFLALFRFLAPPDEFRLNRVFPLILVVLSTLLAVYFVSEQWGSLLYLYPAAAGIILIATLYDLKVAVLASVTNSLLLGVLFNFDFEIAFFTIIGGFTVAFIVREIKKRSDFYRCAFYLAIVQAITAYVFESLKFTDTDLILRYCAYAAGNAAVSTFIAMAVLPLFESMFFFTTNVTLLELSDMNHPLLKRLAMEAPGTYHHSVVVGNLAEAAAESIGANSLLARVGAYYHDIGKMEISEYFIENQLGAKSKHTELTPTMSALVIGSHIKRGCKLAEEFDLPDKIIEFIEEHHGTSIMSYFYNKAKEESSDTEVPETEFRYPGPKPQSKETALLMISDAVEAASRTLEDPKPSRIRNLVRRLILEKFQSGELSDSNLTLADLKKIEDAFVFVLIGVFHARIDYPQKESMSEK